MVKFLLCTLVLCLMSITAYSDVPQLLSYQGLLTDNLGDPLDGTYNVTFSIYADEVGGVAVWTEVRSVDVVDGSFSLYLGELAELTDMVFSDSARYLGVKVDTDPEMTRTRMSTSPFAYRVATVDGSVSEKLTLTDTSGTVVELSAGADVLKAYDSDGWLRIKMSFENNTPLASKSAGVDGGGAISFYPAGLFNKSNEGFSGKTGSVPGSLVRIGESAEGTGEINTFDSDGNELTRMTSTSIDGGAYYTYLADGTRLTVQGQAIDTGGYIGTYGTNGNAATAFSSLVGNPGYGFISVKDSSGTNRVGMYADFGADGHFFTRNRHGQTTVEISNLGDLVTAGGGFVQVRGTNGSLNISLWNLGGYDNNGYIDVYDENGVSQAGIYVDANGDGIVFGDVKSFAMPNPLQAGTELWYSSLEGPEAAAYIRGTETLEKGKAIVYFPEHFVTVASLKGMTVQIVPLSADSRGLAVVEKHADHIVVQELHHGKGSYSFDYTVTAVRKGFEDYQVVHDVKERKLVRKSLNRQPGTQSKLRNTVNDARR